MNGLVAGLTGLLVGGSVAAAILLARGKVLAQRGAMLEASLLEGGDDLRTYYLAQRGEIETRIVQIARQTGEPVARQAAAQYLTEVYGLTPERIVRLQALAARWS